MKASRLIRGDKTLYANPIVASKDRRGRITPKSAWFKRLKKSHKTRKYETNTGHEECHSKCLTWRTSKEPFFDKV